MHQPVQPIHKVYQQRQNQEPQNQEPYNIWYIDFIWRLSAPNKYTVNKRWYIHEIVTKTAIDNVHNMTDLNVYRQHIAKYFEVMYQNECTAYISNYVSNQTQAFIF